MHQGKSFFSWCTSTGPHVLKLAKAGVPLQLRGGGVGSKPDRIRGLGGGNRLEGPSCTKLAFFSI